MVDGTVLFLTKEFGADIRQLSYEIITIILTVNVPNKWPMGAKKLRYEFLSISVLFKIVFSWIYTNGTAHFKNCKKNVWIPTFTLT